LTKDDVVKIKAQMDEAQSTKMKLQAKLEVQYDIAKKEYNCETIEEIDALIDTLDAELDKLTKDLDEKMKSLEEAYDWDL
jgi:cob(I)alamin adenosyltransferase